MVDHASGELHLADKGEGRGFQRPALHAEVGIGSRGFVELVAQQPLQPEVRA